MPFMLIAYRRRRSNVSRLLVTGGAGFIGSNFVRRSLELDPELKITVLDSLTYAGNLENLASVMPNIEFIQGDISDSVLVDELVSNSDVVVNFAAESHNDNSLNDARPFIQSNIVGVFELISASAKHSKRFHQISTDEVYGDLPIESSAQFTSDSLYNPSSPYSASKASADMLVRAWHRSFGLRATISNCSNNFGPNQHREKLIPRTVLLAEAGIRPKVYGDGKNVRDWIHVDDHTDGVWAILNRGQMGETYLLGARSERNNLQVVREILRITGKDEDFIEFVPDRPGHDLRYAIDPTKAENELDWRATARSFEELLPGVVESYLGRSKDVSEISGSGPSVTKSKAK
jgi:dTDP-glucose 4,6-dehydratase